MSITMKKAVIAVRVSSTKQGLVGDSPEDQKMLLEKLAITPVSYTHLPVIKQVY